MGDEGRRFGTNGPSPVCGLIWRPAFLRRTTCPNTANAIRPEPIIRRAAGSGTFEVGTSLAIAPSTRVTGAALGACRMSTAGVFANVPEQIKKTLAICPNPKHFMPGSERACGEPN